MLHHIPVEGQDDFCEPPVLRVDDLLELGLVLGHDPLTRLGRGDPLKEVPPRPVGRVGNLRPHVTHRDHPSAHPEERRVEPIELRSQARVDAFALLVLPDGPAADEDAE